MKLKLRRTQRDTGLVSTTVLFCLNARAELSDHERNNLARYKLYDQVIYNSEAAKRSLEKSMAATDQGTASGYAKGILHLAVTALRLNVTVRSVERGQYIECKSMEELLAAEEAIKEACQNLKIYLDIASTFDGAEVVFDYAGDTPRIVAQAIRPEPILAPAPAGALGSSADPLLLPTTEPSPDTGHVAATYENADATVGRSYAPNPLDSFIEQVSDATGLDQRRARLVMIAIAVVLVLMLLAKCHG